MHSRLIKPNSYPHYYNICNKLIIKNTLKFCTSTRVHEATITENEGSPSVNTENVSMDPKKLRKKLKRKHKFDQIRQLKTLREIKKYGVNYHGIDTSKDFVSKIDRIDIDYEQNESQKEKKTRDDLYFEGLKKRDMYNFDYTDVNIDEIQSETYKMEQYYQKRNNENENENINEFGQTFESLGIGKQLCHALKWKEITKPTEIQRKVIPNLLNKMDLITNNNKNNNLKKHIVELTCFGDSTGRGKTLAYLLPVIEAIKRDIEISNLPLRINRPRALILAPTRELCVQIRNVIRDLSPFIGISSCVLTAGQSRKNQLKKLRSGIDIVCATPHRIKQHIDISSSIKHKHSQNMFSLVDTRYVILDEFDVLLNEGFWQDEINDILSRIGCFKSSEIELKSNIKIKGGLEKINKVTKYSKRIQLIISSATITQNDIVKFCDYLGFNHSIKMINTQSLHCILPVMNMYFWDVSGETMDKLQTLKYVLRQEQIIYNQKLAEKYNTNFDQKLLEKQINKPKYIGLNSNFVPQQTIIFCRTKQCAAAVSHFLDENNFNNVLYFGVHSPFDRADKFKSFVENKSSILVATDVAMRGLDISNVTHVVLYSFPHSPRAFIHRIGRTGRINTITSNENIGECECKISGLIDKYDTFIAGAILTAINEGNEIINLNLNQKYYKSYPHLKLKTAASNVSVNNMNKNLIPFEPMPVKLLSTQEIEEKKKEKKMGKWHKKYKKKISSHKDLDKPRLWYYSNKIGKTRTPFFNIKKKIVKKLTREMDESERRKLLLKYTTERKVLPGGWANNRNRRRMKKPSIYADK